MNPRPKPSPVKGGNSCGLGLARRAELEWKRGEGCGLYPSGLGGTMGEAVKESSFGGGVGFRSVSSDEIVIGGREKSSRSEYSSAVSTE